MTIKKMKQIYTILILTFANFAMMFAQNLHLQYINFKITSAKCGSIPCKNFTMRFCHSYDSTCVNEHCRETYDLKQSKQVNVSEAVGSTLKFDPWSSKQSSLPEWIIILLKGPPDVDKKFCLQKENNHIEDNKLMMNISKGDTIMFKFEIWSGCDDANCTDLECKCGETTTIATSTQSSPSHIITSSELSSVSIEPTSSNLSSELESTVLLRETTQAMLSASPTIFRTSMLPSLEPTTIHPSTELTTFNLVQTSSMSYKASISSHIHVTKETTKSTYITGEPTKSTYTTRETTTPTDKSKETTTPKNKYTRTTTPPSTVLSSRYTTAQKSSTGLFRSSIPLMPSTRIPPSNASITPSTTVLNNKGTAESNTGEKDNTMVEIHWIYVAAGVGGLELLIILFLVLKVKRLKRHSNTEYTKDIQKPTVEKRNEDFYAGHSLDGIKPYHKRDGTTKPYHQIDEINKPYYKQEEINKQKDDEITTL